MPRSPESREESFNRMQARSYENLEKARGAAARSKDGYHSARTRQEIQDIFTERFGREAYTWQLDITEALILGLDCVLIAGTGAGKTMPFMMPLLLDKNKKVIIISPLKILQYDQVSRFKKMRISAAAVNGDTWCMSLRQKLEKNAYQALFAGPEMCIQHPEFRKIIRTDMFAKDLVAVIIDEAHCISQWGGDFRPGYGLLDKLRSIFPPNVPILATSATVGNTALRDLRASLLIEADACFHLNLGNDRPNISTSIHRMNNAHDYDALKPQRDGL